MASRFSKNDRFDLDQWVPGGENHPESPASGRGRAVRRGTGQDRPRGSVTISRGRSRSGSPVEPASPSPIVRRAGDDPDYQVRHPGPDDIALVIEVATTAWRRSPDRRPRSMERPESGSTGSSTWSIARSRSTPTLGRKAIDRARSRRGSVPLVIDGQPLRRAAVASSFLRGWSPCSRLQVLFLVYLEGVRERLR